MKKFYLFSILVATLATANAQSSGVCPGGDPIFVRNIMNTTTTGQTYCVIILDNTWPNAEVVVRGKDNFGNDVIVPSTAPTPAGGWKTANDSSIVYQYDCNMYFAQKIEVTKLGVGTCVTLIPPAAPLPIKLAGFTGKLQNETMVKLDFTSVIEYNSKEYVVERSADGKSYTTVGNIKAAGNSSHDIKYTYTDKLPTAGGYWYRLKQVDIDGAVETSKAVYINSKGGNGVVTSVFPNPFINEIQLIGATSADLNTPGRIKLFNMTGQQIHFRIVGANAILVDSKAPKGVYFLRVSGEDAAKFNTFKLVKN